MTSFTAANLVRKVFCEKKAGHTGTLDPMATGVLPVAVGRATGFIDLLPTAVKSYRAGFSLGAVTDTLDVTGTVIETYPVDVGAEEVAEAASRFLGACLQVPPAYSAIKRGGVRMYELARRGETVDIPPREIRIYSLACAPDGENSYILDVTCSKGTYIRALIRDIGQALGTGAVMTSLRRTAANGFHISQAHTLDELRSADDPEGYIVPIEKALGDLSAAVLTDAQAKRFVNGGSISVDRLRADPGTGLIKMYSPSGELLGVGLRETGAAEIGMRKLL